MILTYNFGDDYHDEEYELELDSSDIMEFLLNLSQEEAEEFVKDNDYNLEEVDLRDALDELSLEDDIVKDYFEDSLKDFFEEVAREQFEESGMDDYALRGLSRSMFF